MSGRISSSVSVITPSLPERSGMLEKCRESVENQTVPVEHIIVIDERHEGPQPTRNRAARQAKGEWLLPLHDDDTLDPDCIEVLLDHAGAAEIIYPWCRMSGRTDTWVPNRLFNAKTLAR